MAIASGLTCVDYLASNFYSPTYSEDQYRYSPTLAYDNDVFTNYVSQKHRDQQTNVFDAPFLEFTRLSLAETTFDFTTSSIDKNKQGISNNGCYNEEFITEFEKMRNVLSIKRTPTKTKEKVEDDDDNIHPFSVNNESCQDIPTKDVVEANSVADYFESLSDNEEDEELNAIFIKSKYSPRVLRSNAARFKSNSLPHFKRHIEEEKGDEEEVSDSEMELVRITTPQRILPQQRFSNSCPRNNNIIGSGSNRKRRTSAESPHSKSPSDDEQVLSASLTKRPCIDAEKMHRSMVLRSSRPCLRKVRRNLLDKDLFVPIDQ